jgi:hypothetical protein
MSPTTNLRAQLFEELLALKADLAAAAKRWRRHCPATERLYRRSATTIGRLINYRRDDAAVCRTLAEVGNALALHGAAAIFPEAGAESSRFARRTLALLPEGTALQLKLFLN